MTDQTAKSSASDSLKQALAAKKAAAGKSGFAAGPEGARSGEKAMQRQVAALNKPAFRRASKRG